jgi:hypothetical protein
MAAPAVTLLFVICSAALPWFDQLGAVACSPRERDQLLTAGCGAPGCEGTGVRADAVSFPGAGAGLWWREPGRLT